MNPPEEQLIRDYVNRVSVAARGRLSPEDRRAFVARTRELIEQNTRGAGAVSPMGVARFLNGLGDPAALVSRECDRLAVQPPDATAPPPPGAGPPRSRPTRERRPRSARGAWRDRLRPSGGALSGVPVPRPAAPDVSDGDAAGAAGDGPARGGAPRQVLAGDVVTGPVPTGDEPLPGPPSESVSRPVPGPPASAPQEPLRGFAGFIWEPAPGPAAATPEPSPGPPAAAAEPPPLPADVRPRPRRLGWPWQGMSDPAADRGSANGHGPVAGAGDAAEEDAAAEVVEEVVEEAVGEAVEEAVEEVVVEAVEEDAADAVEEDAAEARADEPGSAGSGPAPEADRPPDAGRAPVIGRWAGGAPVAGEAAAAPSPPSFNGRVAANGHGPADGAAPGDFAPGDFSAGDVVDSEAPGRPGTARPPEGDGPRDAAPASDPTREPDRQERPGDGQGAGEAGAGAAPAEPAPARRGPRAPGTRGTGQNVSSWAGWKPPRPASAGPSRLRASLHPPALPWPWLSRLLSRSGASAPDPAAPGSAAAGPAGPPGPRPAAAGPAAPGRAAPRGNEPRPGRPSRPSSALEAAGALARKAARYAAARARERPLEAASVVLIGLGGAVYPPVWLLGAALALASRVWDVRDKWLGLAIPLFAVIVGMGADVSLSGRQATFSDYFREAWIFGGHLCRVVAVLGAVYLAWRSQRPARQQSAEPWNKRGRFS
ncbi:MAG TPA: hypothetical protein VGM79_05205 [Streptosporangiaceae bacterium]